MLSPSAMYRSIHDMMLIIEVAIDMGVPMYGMIPVNPKIIDSMLKMKAMRY